MFVFFLIRFLVRKDEELNYQTSKKKNLNKTKNKTNGNYIKNSKYVETT